MSNLSSWNLTATALAMPAGHYRRCRICCGKWAVWFVECREFHVEEKSISIDFDFICDDCLNWVRRVPP